MRVGPATQVRFGVFSQLSGVLLLLVVVFAPLAFACTRPNPLTWLSFALHLVFVTWLLGLGLERRLPGIPFVALIVGIALILFAWLRLVFFEPAAVSTFTAGHFSRIYDRWPESIILRTPQIVTFLTSGLLCGFFVATDLTRTSAWRRRLLYTIVTAGCLVVAIGLLQNATHARGIYWESPKNHMPSRFFGPFYHFTSAGAFINLTWPIAAAMALNSLKQYMAGSRTILSCTVWGILSAWLLVGHTGHVSRFPQVIAGAIVIGLIVTLRPFAQVKWSWRSFVLCGITTLVIGGGLFAVVARSGRINEIAARWKMLSIFGENGRGVPPPVRADWPKLMRDDLVVPYNHNHVFLRDRGAAYAFAVEAIMRRPLLGFGPGGWIAAVSQHSTDLVLGTFYLYLQFTHQDLLQLLIEWGMVGGVLYLILVVGGVYTALRGLMFHCHRTTPWSDSSALILGALAAVVAVLVQSSIDFPLQIPAYALYATLLLAVCWSSARQNRPSAFSTKNVHEQ